MTVPLRHYLFELQNYLSKVIKQNILGGGGGEVWSPRLIRVNDSEK